MKSLKKCVNKQGVALLVAVALTMSAPSMAVSARENVKTVYARQGRSVVLKASFKAKNGRKIKILKKHYVAWSMSGKNFSQGGIASGKKFKIKRLKADDFYNGKNKMVYTAHLSTKKGKILATTKYRIIKK